MDVQPQKVAGAAGPASDDLDTVTAWWDAEWRAFPTVSQRDDGSWCYWRVRDDSGRPGDDWAHGEALARATIAQMQRFPEGSTVLRRILREMDFNSGVAIGFLDALEQFLVDPRAPAALPRN